MICSTLVCSFGTAVHVLRGDVTAVNNGDLRCKLLGLALSAGAMFAMFHVKHRVMSNADGRVGAAKIVAMRRAGDIGSGMSLAR
jgi:hypothetical protein